MYTYRWEEGVWEHWVGLPWIPLGQASLGGLFSDARVHTIIPLSHTQGFRKEATKNGCRYSCRLLNIEATI